MKRIIHTISTAVFVLLLLTAGTLQGRAAVTGDRPLLVVLLEYRDRSFADPRYLDNYKARVFGPLEPNVTSFYRETSHGHFTYVAATNGETYGTADGVVRVWMDVRQEDAPSGSEFRTRALQLANAYFDYSRYDTNRDGKIQDRELTVLVIHA